MSEGSRQSGDTNLRYTLLTGATGLVGQYLTRDLLLEGERLAVLVRPSKTQSAVARIDEIVTGWEEQYQRSLPRPVVLSGCITATHCGLNAESMSWVRQHVRRIVHNAAVLKFQGSDRSREPWVTNVGGTQNILNLARETRIRDLHYVSTAYVCGEQTGVILEDQLDVGQSFRNDYERSKFEAESLVRDCGWIDRPTIYRPAVIAGDSETGYTTSYHGLYLYLRLIAMLVPRVQPDENGIRHTPIRLPMSGSEPRNVVPVNWVSKVITRLLGRREAWGKTFHLSPETPITARRVVEYCYSYFQSEGVVYCTDGPSPNAPPSEFEEEFLRNVQLYRPYDRSDPIFDRTNLFRLAGDLPCPAIDEAVLHRYLEFGEEDRWGKRRKRSSDPALDLREVLRCSLGETSRPTSWSPGVHRLPGVTLEAGRLPLGLDIQGPGGGQWQLINCDDGGIKLQRGLPLDSTAPILRISLAELAGSMEDVSDSAAEYFQNLGGGDQDWADQLITDLRRGVVSAAN